MNDRLTDRLPDRLPDSPPPEMKGRNPWHTPVTIIITVIGVIATVALVTVIVLQNREIHQKYKVTWSVGSQAEAPPTSY